MLGPSENSGNGFLGLNDNVSTLDDHFRAQFLNERLFVFRQLRLDRSPCIGAALILNTHDRVDRPVSFLPVLLRDLDTGLLEGVFWALFPRFVTLE